MQKNKDQLLAAVRAGGFQFTPQRNHLAIQVERESRRYLIGLQAFDDAVASAFVFPVPLAACLASSGTGLVDCLNRCMPVGQWSCGIGSSQLLYRCRLPIPAHPAKQFRFFCSFVRRQAELILACCDVIVAVQSGQNPQQAIATAMRRLQPMSESLPPDEQITPRQWERAIRALQIDPGSKVLNCHQH
jgi:hypothetical protein